MAKNLNGHRAARKILSYYGAESQKRQLIEEMAELTKAINKEWRFNNGFIDGNFKNFENCVIEEMADVIVCLTQIIIAYKCEHKIFDTVDEKLKRTIERIELKGDIKNENQIF